MEETQQEEKVGVSESSPNEDGKIITKDIPLE